MTSLIVILGLVLFFSFASFFVVGGRFLIFLILVEFFLLMVFICYIFSGLSSFFLMGVSFLALVACGAAVGLSILVGEGRKSSWVFVGLNAVGVG